MEVALILEKKKRVLFLSLFLLAKTKTRAFSQRERGVVRHEGADELRNDLGVGLGPELDPARLLEFFAQRL